MILDVLPDRTDSAAGNMAADFLLLQRYPTQTHARFRAYGWHRPAFTFGVSQKIAWVRAQLADVEPPFELCRRPTGGGLVDHREDWTYALVIPRAHPLEAVRAVESYRAVHEALASALNALGGAVELQPPAEPSAADTSATGICFRQAEVHDVIQVGSGTKVAGAAQKRTKHGLLLQGSIWRPAAGKVQWDALAEEFSQRLAGLLAADLTAANWPEYNEDEWMGLAEHYASPDWIEHR